MIPIRPASSIDAPTLAALHQAHFRRAWSEAEFLSFYERDGIIAYLAETQMPAGFIFCWAVAGECELLCLAVEKDFRRQGLARHLCEMAIKDSLAFGSSVMHLEVAISNKPAQALYHSLGFEIIHRRKNYYRYPDGSSEDALTMRCDLA